MKDDFGNRIKAYEFRETKRQVLPGVPVVARLDGHNFSTFTRGLAKPYDVRLCNVMRDTAVEMVKYSGAVAGYTASDEISLVLYNENTQSQHMYGGKIQKLVGGLAAHCTGIFNRLLTEHIPEKAVEGFAEFDCRVFEVPSKTEAANTVLWREQDQSKNSIQCAAQQYYSHKQLHKASISQQMDMLMQKGVNWNDYPEFYKRGYFVLVSQVERELTEEELSRMTAKIRAQNEGRKVLRRLVQAKTLPVFSKVTNREQVIFEGAEAETASPS